MSEIISFVVPRRMAEGGSRHASREGGDRSQAAAVVIVRVFIMRNVSTGQQERALNVPLDILAAAADDVGSRGPSERSMTDLSS
jgi:hypothetical protein